MHECACVHTEAALLMGRDESACDLIPRPLTLSLEQVPVLRASAGVNPRLSPYLRVSAARSVIKAHAHNALS